MTTAIVQTSGGPIHGEDRLETRIAVAAGAAAHITSQGAVAVHRATHPDSLAREAMRLTIEDGGLLEYLPGPRILFPDAALEAVLDINCAPDGRAIVADAFTIHDPALQGRSFRSLEATVLVRRGASGPLLIDRQRLEAMQPRHFARYAAYGTMLMLLPMTTGAARALAQRLSARMAEVSNLYAAASLLPNDLGLGLRFSAPDLRPVRLGMDAAWRMWREEVVGVAPTRSLAGPSQ